VLHGCGGFSTFDHRLAGDLPQEGIATLYIDFFAPTPPPGDRGFCGGPKTRRAASHQDVFSRWERVVLDAAAALRHARGINPHRVGVVGWSLGGGLAIATAESAVQLGHGGTPFAAVVSFSTGLGHDSQMLIHLPPLLLLSGGTTDAVPLSATEALFRAARAAGDHVELFVYPHGVHDWRGRQGRAGINRAVRFLRARMS
jgi:dienelactone hydrolase